MNNCKYILSVLLIGLTFFSKGQQLPLGNLYGNNTYILNPALAGVDGCIKGFLNHRRQWVGLENAPVTSFISGDGYLGKGIGIGAKIYNDKAGILNQMYALTSVAYHLDLNESNKLSIGLSGGFFRSSINLDGVVINDVSENIFDDQTFSGSTFETDFGVAYTSRKITLSASIPRLIESKANLNIANTASSLFALKRHAVFYGSYDIQVNENVVVKPSILTRWVPSIDFLYDINTDVIFNNRYTLGLGYRETTGAIVRVGALLNDRFNLNYAFEVPIGNANLNTGGSHEIQFGIKLCKKVKEDPYSVVLTEDSKTKTFKFKTLKELNDFLVELDETDPVLSAQLREQMKDPTLRDLDATKSNPYNLTLTDDGEEKKFSFKTLRELNEFLVELDEKDPIFSAQLREQLKDPTLRDLDASKITPYTVTLIEDGEEQKFKFKTLEALNGFLIQLNRKDPILAAQLREQMEDPTLRDLDASKNNPYTVTLTDNEEQKKFKFKTLEALNEFLVELDQKDPVLAAQVREQMKNPNLRNFDASKNAPYTVTLTEDGEQKKFKFKTLEALNEFLVELDQKDPVLAAQVREQMKNPNLRNFDASKNAPYTVTLTEDGEEKKFKFKTLEALNEFLVQLDEKDPIFSAQLREQLKDPTLRNLDASKINPYTVTLIEDGKEQKFKFKTLEALNSFLIQLDKKNPILAAQIREQMKDPTLRDLDAQTKSDLSVFNAEVLFPLNGSKYDAKFIESLDKIVTYMLNNSDTKVNVIGHSCDLGSSQVKETIAITRANVVKNYLVSKGVKRNRIVVKGVSDSNNKLPNTSTLNRQKNRRVHFEVK